MTSNAPPAAKGTTIVTGRVGQSCAAAGCGRSHKSPHCRSHLLHVGKSPPVELLERVASRSWTAARENAGANSTTCVQYITVPRLLELQGVRR